MTNVSPKGDFAVTDDDARRIPCYEGVLAFDFWGKENKWVSLLSTSYCARMCENLLISASKSFHPEHCLL